jgi:hypothetical protein
MCCLCFPASNSLKNPSYGIINSPKPTFSQKKEIFPIGGIKMNYFLELTKMERIEVMRLALETLVAIKQLPKSKLKSDAIQAVRDIAEIYAIHLTQKKNTEQPVPQTAAVLRCESSSDLISSLKIK